ncbi:MAG TPA: type II secretion system protein GspE [Candidatus Omnitrophica bacterium]|nr:type II secretion system protein GspE [Candidatus Omnitrophota bacterium]HBG62724.1 type II secretion system protein GspE [Candidatus Omnitrophota bacterium]
MPPSEKNEKPIQEPAIPSGVIDDNPVVLAVNKILVEGIEKGSSDILIEPLDNEVQVRYRIDGILHRMHLFPKSFQDGIVGRIKVMSGLDISEHRLPQDGRLKMTYSSKEVDLRVSVLPASLGEKVVLRVLDKSRTVLDISTLGFDQRTLELLKVNLVKPVGMILVCGATGSGKTTTLYSAVQYIDSIDKNIVTVEDPVEYQLYGINQVAVSEDIGLNFASALRSILRQDPDVVLVGEIRDFEAADIAIKASLTGHLLLSTLHTISATGSTVRLMNMGIEPFLIASSCLLVVAQVLARLLCPKCKEPYHPSKEVADVLRASHLSLDEQTVLYRKKGCNECNHAGFKGRTVVAESLEITASIRDLIIARASEQDIRNAAYKEGMVSISENGFQLVLEGLTTMDEILRVTSLE